MSARAVADFESGKIIAAVEIAAPIARVFAALTDGAEILQWWGSADTYRTERWESDLRAGGRWRATGTSADGSAFFVAGEFLEVSPPTKIVQTWRLPGKVARSRPSLTRSRRSRAQRR